MSTASNRQGPGESDFPYWLVGIGAILAVVAALIAFTDVYSQAFQFVIKGLWITVYVTLISFALACFIGLAIAVMGLSKRQLLRQIARFYVELIRGIPMLVLLMYITFVVAPGLVWLINLTTTPLQEQGLVPQLRSRDVPLIWRAVAALVIGYSAFISEVFRAGILSVSQGQVEAAQALGLTAFQRFRLIIMPQAIRTILPPLGNDFVALVKDSSLVSVVGVADIAQVAKLYAAGNFRYLETYNIVAAIYLMLTTVLSIALRRLEIHLAKSDRR